MVVITLQRHKCIGCNYCVDLAPKQFQISKKDGKSVLLHATEKSGFHTLKSQDNSIFNGCKISEKLCPVKIISTKRI